MDEQIMRIVGACAMVKVHAGEVVTWALIEVRNIISQHSQSAQRAQIKKWQPAMENEIATSIKRAMRKLYDLRFILLIFPVISLREKSNQRHTLLP